MMSQTRLYRTVPEVPALTSGDELRDAGQTLIEGLLYLENAGRLPGDNATNIFNSVVAVGFMTAASTQTTRFNVRQSIIADCRDDIPDLTQNVNCKLCREVVSEFVNSRASLEQNAKSRNSDYVIQTPTTETVSTLRGRNNDLDGVCRYMCYQCVFENLNQDMYVQIDSSVDVSTTTFRNHYNAGLKMAARKQIQRYQNQIDEIGYSIRNSVDNLEALSLSFANIISSVSSVEILNFFKTSALALQQLQLGSPTSTSLVVSHVRQSVNLSMMSSLTSQVFNRTSLVSMTNFSTDNNVIKLEEDFASTLRSFTGLISSLESVLKTSIGKIMIAILALLGAVVVMVVMFLFVRPVVKSKSSTFSTPTDDSAGVATNNEGFLPNDFTLDNETFETTFSNDGNEEIFKPY